MHLNSMLILLTLLRESGLIKLQMKMKQVLPSKKVLLNVISISLLSCVVLGAITFVLKNPIDVLNAQTNPTSYWNVERDPGNNLNFSFTTNSAPGPIGLQLLSNGLIQANTQISTKQGITTGFAGTDSGMTGAKHYQFGYQEPGAWTAPFPDLVLGYHTGIKMGANIGYGGVKFFADHPSVSTTQLFSVGDGDNNVRVANWLMFPNAGYGIHAPENNAYIRSNTGSFGAWKIQGSRGGWGGLEFEAPYSAAQGISLMVGHNTHANSNVYTGMHLNNVGWLWYSSGKDLYTGTAGSTTAGSMFAESFRDLGNQGYYLDPAGVSNLNVVNAQSGTFTSGPYTNDWYRVNGAGGIYWQQYGGGWTMTDSTYIRSYGNKPLQFPYNYDSDDNAYYMDLNNTTRMRSYTDANGNWFAHPNGWNYIRGNSYIAGDTGVILANGNVGIGTTAPQGKLGVGFGNGDQLTVYQPGDDALAIQTTLNGQPNNGYGGHASNRLVLQPTTGRVGIKQSNPQSDLHIKQASNSQGDAGIRLERADNGNWGTILYGGNDATHIFSSNNASWCQLSPSASWTCGSDRRLKKNIRQLEGSALEIISGLKPSNFDWINTGAHGAGFIAQEVLEVLPGAVDSSDVTGMYTVTDSYFTPYLVKGLQELDGKDNAKQLEINELKKKLQEQTDVNNAQADQLSTLRNELEELKKEIRGVQSSQ